MLGNHRLYCGDSTDEASLEKVLEGEIADITVCDPPYNVDYVQIKFLIVPRDNKMLNDNLGKDFENFLQKACSNIFKYTNGAVYIFMGTSELPTLKKAFEQAGGYCSTFIMWVKNHFALSRGDYHQQYEPILYGWCKERYWAGERDQADVWFCDKPASSNLHPTISL